LIAKSEAAILLKGAAYILKPKNKFDIVKGVEWLNPFFMQSKYVKGRLLFWQQLPTGERYPEDGGFWTADDFIYMRDFNPTDDLGEGISATQVALGDGKSLAAITQFVGNFFESDAVPVTMITVPSGTGEPQKNQIMDWFKERFSRKSRSKRVIAVNADVKVETLTQELKSFDIEKLDTHSIQAIAWAFDTPKTLLTSDSANFATAGSEYQNFLNLTIVPRCRFYERHLNTFLKQYGQRIKFAEEELPEMQEDEKDRSVSLKQLRDSGIPLLAALDILGYDISDDSMALIEEEVAKREAQPPPVVVQPGKTPQDNQPNQQDEMVKAELDKWMRKSLNAHKSHKSACVEFETDKIPAEMKSTISDSLRAAKTEEEIRASFKEVICHTT